MCQAPLPGFYASARSSGGIVGQRSVSAAVRQCADSRVRSDTGVFMLTDCRLSSTSAIRPRVSLRIVLVAPCGSSPKGNETTWSFGSDPRRGKVLNGQVNKVQPLSAIANRLEACGVDALGVLDGELCQVQGREVDVR